MEFRLVKVYRAYRACKVPPLHAQSRPSRAVGHHACPTRHMTRPTCAGCLLTLHHVYMLSLSISRNRATYTRSLHAGRVRATNQESRHLRRIEVKNGGYSFCQWRYLAAGTGQGGDRVDSHVSKAAAPALATVSCMLHAVFPSTVLSAPSY